jgi:hypothetical protein
MWAHKNEKSGKRISHVADVEEQLELSNTVIKCAN